MSTIKLNNDTADTHFKPSVEERVISTNGKQTYLFLVEAAATELDQQGRISGSLDIPLSPIGQAQAEKLAQSFGQKSLDKVYGASCLAARETAQMIAANAQVKLKVIEAWTNLDHGLWHGRCIEEIKETLPKFYRQWQESPGSVSPPAGETGAAVEERCRTAVQKIKRKWAGGRIAIVAPQPLLGILGDLFGEA